jgi:hypothetical protein
MKTTFDLPDEVVIEAKKLAAELRVPLRQLVEEGLRERLARPRRRRARPKKIRWVVVRGGLPRDLDIADRENMHEWIRKARS